MQLNQSLSAGFLGLAMIIGGALASQEADSINVDVLNVKRINVLNEDGSYSLVVANSDGVPGPIRNGKEFGSRAEIPGIIFYNNKGDEVGGLIYPGRDLETGARGSVHLSMDQINQGSQAIFMAINSDGDWVRSSLQIRDLATDAYISEKINATPGLREIINRMNNAENSTVRNHIHDNEYLPAMGKADISADRIYLGSEGTSMDRVAKLEIKDSMSRPRIRLSVDENDQPRIEILDEEGRIARAL